MRFNVLLNPPKFETHAHFQAEYLLMSDERRIASHFGLRRVQPSTGDDLPPDFERMFGRIPFMAEDYIVWEKIPSKTLSWDQLPPRRAFDKWMHAHFLKICLPYPRPLFSDAPVYAPLNLTAILRLVIRMHEVGYPTHWLSGILASFCDGRIQTITRAPRQLVMDRRDIKEIFPSLEISVNPWKAEFSTLLSIWNRLLGFGIIASPGTLLSPDNICEYAVTFPAFSHPQLLCPHFMLVFWNASEGKPPREIRRLLLDDEMGDRSTATKGLREKAVHCFTTFRYVTDTRIATFWCRKDVMDALAAGKWEVFVWRTDTWEKLTRGVSVRDGVTLQRSWGEN
jgi:hypothetical protein